MIKGEQAVKGHLSGLDKQLSDIFVEEDSMIQRRLCPEKKMKAEQRLINCTKVLKKVIFLSFDVKEWIVENDLLVHRLKEDDSETSVQEVLDNFKSLLDRVQGLPPKSSFICYELAIAYNISHLLLQGQTNLPVGGHHKCVTILSTSLFRALKAFKIDNCNQETTGDEVELFSISHIDHTLEQLLPSLFKAFCDNNIGCAPLVLSCCLLAFLWLLEESVKPVKAVELLTSVQSYLKRWKEDTGYNSKQEVDTGRCPVYLFSLEYIPSITNVIIASSTGDAPDIENLLPVVTSLLAFSHYANQDFDKVLKTLDDRVCSQGVGFNDLYLNGYVLYVRNEVDKALKCFQQCVDISQGQDRAAALIMIGCCCAAKGKNHTAVAKFREAMENDFQQLEALFNICVHYRKLGNFTAEIQCLKLLKQIMKGKMDSERCYNVAVFPSGPGSHQNNRKIELTVPPRFTLTSAKTSVGITTELVTYMLAKRSVELGRFDEAADSYLELLANIVEMRSAISCNAANLPSPTELYHQCADTLLKAGRYEDTVTVCDKLLTTADSIQPPEKGNNDEQNTNSRAPKKRLRSSGDENIYSTDEETATYEMLMLKAEALVYLHQPLEALNSLKRVLKALKGVQSSSFCSTHEGHEAAEEQQRKRRRIGSGDSNLSMEQSQNFEPNKLVKVKVRACNQKASILESLGQNHDALHQLHLSLECLPDNPGTVYKHTQLLLKLGSEKEAVTNWLRFRGVQSQNNRDLGAIKRLLRSSIVKLLDSEEVTLEQVQTLDERALEWCSKAREDPFYPGANVL